MKEDMCFFRSIVRDCEIFVMVISETEKISASGNMLEAFPQTRFNECAVQGTFAEPFTFNIQD